MLETWFPNLRQTGYEHTSARDIGYNCVAWAAGDQTRWWENLPLPGYYWPDDVGEDGSIESLVKVFEQLGYEVCGSEDIEEGCEKVALYADTNGGYTHAARQLPDGWWTSKIGGFEDIRHRSLHGLCSSDYGGVMFIMKRQSGC